MTLSATLFRWHRWLGWIVGLQVLIWVGGGVVFSLVPFKAWVKGGDTVQVPPLVLPPGWVERVAPALQRAAARDPVAAIATVATPHGPALRLQWQAQRPAELIRLDGQPWVPPTADEVRRFAQPFHRQAVPVRDIERLAQVPRRLLIVAETGGRGDVWRVRFDDALGTRLYFRGDTGEYIGTRTDAWVWYDFFWRLHIMDYDEGEDFNGTLLRVAAVVSLGLVAAGAVLAVLAVRRRWRRRAHAASP